MKRRITGLLAVAGMSVVVAAAAPGRAQPTQGCDAAHQQMQVSRYASKLLDARAQALVCSGAACTESIQTDCSKQLVEIEASMPTVVFAATDRAGADTLAVRLLVDGKLFAEQLDGKAVPLDPGPHAVRFELSGAQPIEQQLVIKEGEKNRRVSVSFKTPEPPPPPPPPPPPSVAPLPARTPTWAWVSGGVGLALVGVAVGFGVDGLGAVSALKTNCGENYSTEPCQTQTGYDWASDNARKNLDLGIFLGAAGLGVIAIGVSIYGIVATRPETPPPRAGRAHVLPTLRLGLGGMVVEGGF